MAKANILKDLQPLAVPVSWLTKLPGNPNKGDVKAVAVMLKTMGQHKPIVVQRNGDYDGHPVGTILAGNTTFEAATTTLKWDTIAVTWTDDDDLTAKARAVGDNRASQLGVTDNDALVVMLSYLSDDAALLQASGYTDDDIQRLIDGPGDHDNNPRAQLDEMTFTILIVCADENHQAQLLARFEDEGLNVRAVMT